MIKVINTEYIKKKQEYKVTLEKDKEKQTVFLKDLKDIDIILVSLYK